MIPAEPDPRPRSDLGDREPALTEEELRRIRGLDEAEAERRHLEGVDEDDERRRAS